MFFHFILLLPVLILGYTNCSVSRDPTQNTSTVGNPVVEFSFGPFQPPASLQHPSLCVDSVEATGDRSEQVDISDQAFTLTPEGGKAFRIELPKGVYTGFKLILSHRCASGRTVDITNALGHFSTTEGLELRFSGQGAITQASMVTLETQNLVNALVSVESEQDLILAVPSTQNDFTVETFECPVGFAMVSPDSFYPTSFCVAKFEAKNVGSVAVSQASGTPWVDVTRTTAVTACRANGTGYDLISNDQWQTIARQIEANPMNWSGSAVGNGKLNIGHCDVSPSSALSVSDVTDAWDQTGNNSGEAVGFGWEQKRQHTLSNGETIWDFGANVHEWVSGEYLPGSFPQPLPTGVYEFTDSTYFPLTDSGNRKILGPFNSGFNTSYSVGHVFVATTSFSALNRGSNYTAHNVMAGIFGAGVGADPDVGFPTLGFRCVYAPLGASHFSGMHPDKFALVNSPF
jgi:hypothetical protein